MIAAIVTAVGVVRYNMQLIYPASLIFLISTVWFLTIRYFRRQAKAKFAVVSEIEKDLPVAAFEMEWKMLSEEKKNSIDLTHLEMFFLLFIALGCVVYIVFELLKAR